VGSAVNDTTRQMGGALGVAVVGSVLSSVYGSRVVEWFDDRVGLLPAGSLGQFTAARDAARDQLGQALAVAERLPGALGPDLARVANDAFVDAMHFGVVAAAAATLLGAVVAFVWLPARARPADVDEQAHEYAEEQLAAARGPATLGPAE
jgi:hypothetical protein